MGLYIEDELSYDSFHTKGANIYRVADDKQTADVALQGATSAAPLAPALLNDFPEIKDAARIVSAEAVVKYQDKIFEERNIYYADNSLFNIFTFPFVSGNPAHALNLPETVVITTDLATKYFGGTDPVGKQLLLDGKPMQVTGVMQNLPANTHLSFDMLISMPTAQKAGSGYDWQFNNWSTNNFYTYLLLSQHTDPKKLQAKLADFDNRHKEKGVIHHYALEKLADLYLRSTRPDQPGKTGSITNLYLFSAIAFFILLIACINFVNLSTATAGRRAKEVGIKKVAGAGRGKLIAQFYTESFVLVFISLFIALVLTSILLPAFNTFSGKSLLLHFLSPLHAVSLLTLLIIISFLSGVYPAFVLSGFQPITALKGKTAASGWNIFLRKGLVVFQFAVSIVLIVCSSVIFTQMNFMKDHELGFKPAQTMVINFEGDKNVRRNLGAIKEQLMKIPGVVSITASSNVPGDGLVGSWTMDFAKKSGDTINTELPIYLADFNYLKQFNIDMAAGRSLSPVYSADTIESMLINETAVKKLGFANAADAMGVKVGMYPNDAVIVGIVKDFHFESLQKPVEALAVRNIPAHYRLLSIQLNSPSIGKTVAAITEKWKLLAPERPLEYNFLDESFNKQYESVRKFSQVFTVFTCLAIFIACLGLLGLALFSVIQRTKEIGIRKVLGASVFSISATLNKGFIQLVVVSALVASPISWYMMNKWLQHFAYQATIHWSLFVVAGLAAILIAVLTISFHSLRAAMANPVKSLRNE